MSTDMQQAPPPASSNPGTGRSNTRVLNEIRRAEYVQGTPNRTMPEMVGKHYHQDGNSYRSAYVPDKIEFVDRGNRMHAYQPISTFTKRTLVEAAQARGWKGLEVTGGERFRQGIYIEAATRGIEVKGYEPTQQDADILQRRTDRKAADANPLVQSYLNAETKGQRDAAIKQNPQLKAAFAGDAAAVAFAEANIDSKKSAANFVARFRDNTAIALHLGRDLPKLGVKETGASKEVASTTDQDRSR